MKKSLVLVIALTLVGCFGDISKQRAYEESKMDHVFGEKKETVTVIEFFDFGCQYCRDAAAVIQNLKAEFEERLIVDQRHLVVHSEAMPVAEGAECARAQGKFQEYHDQYFRDFFGETDMDTIEELALRLELNLAEFRTCMKAGAGKQRIAEDRALAKKYGASGTPFFVIDETIRRPGLMPEESFKKLIEQLFIEGNKTGF